MNLNDTLLFSDALRATGPKAFSVMLKPAGSSCNLRCTYCYYLEKSKLYSKNVSRMSDEILELFIKQYIEAQDVPDVSFVWQGGEPTLMGIEFYKRAVELQKKYANGKRILNSFQTNGSLLTDEWCEFLAKNDMLVGISIDGEAHIHDMHRLTALGRPSHEMVMKGVRLLQKHGVEFNTLSVVNNTSAHFAQQTYRFLKQIGSRFMQFLPVVEQYDEEAGEYDLKLASPICEGKVTEWSVNPIDYGNFLISIFDEWVRNDVGRYYVQIFDATLANYIGARPGVCTLGSTCGDALVMEHNGDVYSCDHFVFPEYLLGNIKDTPLSELVALQRQFDFGLIKRNALPKQCLRCAHYRLCYGECPKHRISTSSDGERGLNYLCEGLSLFFDYVDPYMKFMAKELSHKRAPANVMSWIKNKEKQVIKHIVVPSRNDMCPCGSGKKFKNCCGRNAL